MTALQQVPAMRGRSLTDRHTPFPLFENLKGKFKISLKILNTRQALMSENFEECKILEVNLAFTPENLEMQNNSYVNLAFTRENFRNVK